MADRIIVNKSFETAASAVKPILGLQPGKRGNMTSRDDNDFALSISLDLAVSPAKRLSLHMRKTTGTALDTQQQCVTWRVLASAFHETDSTLAGFKTRHDLDLT